METRLDTFVECGQLVEAGPGEESRRSTEERARPILTTERL